MSAKPNVVVLGGGFAGLETAFHLRYTMKDRVDLTLVSEQSYFLFKPNTIYIPFGANPEDLAHAAERLGCASIAFTYNDPVVFMEYAMDAAQACRARGIKSVANCGMDVLVSTLRLAIAADNDLTAGNRADRRQRPSRREGSTVKSRPGPAP